MHMTADRVQISKFIFLWFYCVRSTAVSDMDCAVLPSASMPAGCHTVTSSNNVSHTLIPLLKLNKHHYWYVSVVSRNC
jgi:hypothetical protein